MSRGINEQAARTIRDHLDRAAVALDVAVQAFRDVDALAKEVLAGPGDAAGTIAAELQAHHDYAISSRDALDRIIGDDDGAPG